ncbi:hypothetical protein D3C77_705070 [compost metagenome]
MLAALRHRLWQGGGLGVRRLHPTRVVIQTGRKKHGDFPLYSGGQDGCIDTRGGGYAGDVDVSNVIIAMLSGPVSGSTFIDTLSSRSRRDPVSGKRQFF